MNSLNSVSGSVKGFTSLLLIMMSLLAIGDDYNPMQRYSFEHEGVEREFFVHVPPGADGPLPVVVGLHGYTSTATGFAYAHDLNAHADATGYIVVYPQGTNFMVATGSSAPFRITTWNSYGEDGPDFDAPPHCTAESARYPCPPGCGECHRCQWEPCTNDVTYVDSVLNEVQANFDTDTSRYYVLGVSNGGMMTTRIVCDLSDRFAAAAPIIGLQPPGHECAAESDLPIMFLMGTLDETIRFDGKKKLKKYLENSPKDFKKAGIMDLIDEDPTSWMAHSHIDDSDAKKGGKGKGKGGAKAGKAGKAAKAGKSGKGGKGKKGKN